MRTQPSHNFAGFSSLQRHWIWQIAAMVQVDNVNFGRVGASGMLSAPLSLSRPARPSSFLAPNAATGEPWRGFRCFVPPIETKEPGQ